MGYRRKRADPHRPFGSARWSSRVTTARRYACVVSSSLPIRSEGALSPEDHQQLAAAYAELRAAVEAYEKFLGEDLEPGKEIVVMNAVDVRVAQERIEAAEQRLWELREKLLGWARPPWAPPATLISDWTLEVDPDFDTEPDGVLK